MAAGSESIGQTIMVSERVQLDFLKYISHTESIVTIEPKKKNILISNQKIAFKMANMIRNSET